MNAPTPEPPRKSEQSAEQLTAAERVMLFCLASHTDWYKMGVSPTAVKKMMVKGLIERDAAGHLALTEQGRAVRFDEG
jgi:hypothetical protein